MGSQSSVGIYAVGHPSLDFALVKVKVPFLMNGSTQGFRMPLYKEPTEALKGQTLRCRGYGSNVFTPGGVCSGSGGPLREAFLPVNLAPVDDYSFSVNSNAKGQGFAPGDSGGGCSALTQQGWALAGILKGPDLGRPENWRDWAEAYVDGTPVPLPDHWFVFTSSHPTFLTRPLPDSYSDTYTWNPCPGGQEHSFKPTFSLEAGQDFISLAGAVHQSH